MNANIKKKLVIVESPSKIENIKKILGKDFDVCSSYGHIRDLAQPSELPEKIKKGPFGKFAIDVENKFEPYYVIPKDKKKRVSDLKKALKSAHELYLATDRDREGEAIAWHLKEVLKPKIPVKRMVFGDITPESIKKALSNTRDIDLNLVNAQETRRILDRLYGYEVSPVLWRKIRSGISAGRVQSVSTRLIVERERKRIEHISANYYSIEANYKTVGQEFKAKLTEINGKKVASSKDFDKKGKIERSAIFHLKNEAEAKSLAKSFEKNNMNIVSVERKAYKRTPAEPFTTSTLQQEAGKKLNFNSRTTMSIAQFLYEQGYITYMRTDSTDLSSQAIKAARTQASNLYGKENVTKTPRKYNNKSKNAQEAHEAIRPAGDNFYHPNDLKNNFNKDQKLLYNLIWQRTIASQMKDAKGSNLTIKLKTKNDKNDTAIFHSSGTTLDTYGFLYAYNKNKEDKPNANNSLQLLKKGQNIKLENISTDKHQTTPPSRYTEASLIKTLDELGIGRPSTYASIISTIIDRGYIYKRGTSLIPSWLAFAVTKLMEEHFENIIEYDFSAAMEEDLDRIANGEEDRVVWLSKFYLGLNNNSHIKNYGLRNIVNNIGEIDAKYINTIPISSTINVRVGRYGPYIERINSTTNVIERANIPANVAPDELTPQKAEEIFNQQPQENYRELGVDPKTKNLIVLKFGRYGPYVTEIIENNPKVKPRTSALFKSMQFENVDLKQALMLLALPRVLGIDNNDGKTIIAQNGRYGPYVKKGLESRKLDNEDQIFDITLKDAIEIFKRSKNSVKHKKSQTVKELGLDPNSGNMVLIKNGIYGPYVTNGLVNITLPKTETIDSLSKEMAISLLSEKSLKNKKK